MLQLPIQSCCYFKIHNLTINLTSAKMHPELSLQETRGSHERGQRGYSWQSRICPGLNANEIQISYDKHHKVSSLVKSHQNTHISVKYKVKITNNPAKYEVLIKQCLRSILDMSGQSWTCIALLADLQASAVSTCREWKALWCVQFVKNC